MSTVTSIIVSFNTRDHTRACLDSLHTQMRETDAETIVVDNDSHDGSADVIAERFPRVDLIRLRSNIGFAAANNLAAKRASGEYLLLLNPDTVVLDDALERLLAFAEANPKAGIWGGRTVFADGSLNPSSCWRRMTLWNQFCRATGLASLIHNSAIFNTEAYGGWKRDSVRNVDIVTGCFMLIRRSLWEELGGFDESFFMYGEDADLCLRSRKLGARPMITPEATIVHHGGASEPVAADKQVRLHTAKVMLIKRHWPAWKRPLGIGLMKLGAGLRASAGPLWRTLRRPALGESGRTWGEVWQRRAEWAGRDGFAGRGAGAGCDPSAAPAQPGVAST